MASNSSAVTLPGEQVVSELAEVLADRSRLPEAPGLVRALSRILLQAVASARQERIQPLHASLQFVGRRLSWEFRGRSIETDARYLLGRIDSMIDLASMALDQSLSTEVIQQAQRKHARGILEHLIEHGDTQAKDLAEAIGVKQNHLSNILRWMEATELVRRSEVGARTWVSLGFKGEATLAAVAAMSPAVGPERDAPAAEATPREFLQRAEPGTLASWLLVGFVGGAFPGIALDRSMRARDVLVAAFQDLPVEAQERVKDAVVVAIGQWRVGAHPASSLEELARLALAVGATDAIPVFGMILEHEQLSATSVRAMLAIIAGFRSIPQARHVLQRLFDAELPAPEFTDDVFLALCACDPDNYARHLVGFVSARDSRPTHHELDRIRATIERSGEIVGHPSSITAMHEISPERLPRVMQLIGWPAVMTQIAQVSRDNARILLRTVPMSDVFEALLHLDRREMVHLIELLLDSDRPLALHVRHDDFVWLGSTDRRYDRTYHAFRDGQEVFTAERVVHDAVVDVLVERQWKSGMYLDFDMMAFNPVVVST